MLLGLRSLTGLCGLVSDTWLGWQERCGVYDSTEVVCARGGPLAALVVLVVNDHWLKGGLLPGAVTGKLSDFAGLLYFPLFVTAAARWLGALAGVLVPRWSRWLHRRLRLTPGKLLASCMFTGAGFTAIRLHAPSADLYLDALAGLGVAGAVAADPTDLWALASLPLAYLVGLGAMEPRLSRGRFRTP